MLVQQLASRAVSGSLVEVVLPELAEGPNYDAVEHEGVSRKPA